MQAPPTPAPRKRPYVPIRVETFPAQMDAPRFLGYAANVSRTGAFLQCCAPRPVGAVIRLRFHLRSSAGETVCCDAQVIWARGYQGRHGPSPGMGVRFLGLLPKGSSVLQDFCE